MSRVRRTKPSTLAGRKRQAELGQIISSPRTPKEERAAALEELNLLAPIVGTPIEIEDSFPTVSNPNPRRPNTESLDAFWKRMTSPEVQVQMHELDKSIAIEKAKNSTPIERAVYLLKSLPDHPLNLMAREARNEIRQDESRRGNPQTVPIETEMRWTLEHWLGPNAMKYNSPRGETRKAIANIYQLLAAKDAAEPGWYVKAAEQRFAKPPQNLDTWRGLEMKRVKTPKAVTPQEATITDPRLREFITRKHADTLAKIKVWTDISNNVRTDQTRKIAEAIVSAEVGTNYAWVHENARAALIEFQLDGWAGVEPSAHTLEWVESIHPVFVTPYEPASQDRNVRKSI